MDTHAKLTILALILLIITTSSFAGPAGCPSYEPPATASMIWTPSSGSGTYSTCLAAADTALNWWRSAYPQYSSCSATFQTVSETLCRYALGNGCSGGLAGTGTCPAGYSLNAGVCTLSNANNVECPPVTCTSGHSLGFAMASDPGVTSCLNGCEVRFKGLTAAQRDAQSGAIGSYQGELEQSGSTCESSPNPAPVVHASQPSSGQDFCITSGGTNFCIEKQRPGCGKVNGQTFCASDPPYSGKCIFAGTSGYVCASPSTAPPIKGETSPTNDISVRLPVQDSSGQPATALPSSSAGGQTGGTYPAESGTYTGPSGNGTGGTNGTGNTQSGTSKNACETHPGSIGCQTVGNYWTSFKDNLKQGFSDIIGSDPGNHPAIGNHSFENTLSSIPINSDAQCPADMTTSIMGVSVAISFSPICQYATGIGNIIFAVATMFALYISLGMPIGRN